MKVLEVYLQKEDGSVEAKTEFTAKELQLLLQLGINVSASAGLGAYYKYLKTDQSEQDPGFTSEDLRAGLND